MAKQTKYEIRIVKVPGSIHEPLAIDKITGPYDVAKWLHPIAKSDQEHFVCLSLNAAGEVVANRIITIGLMNHSLVHPREVFRGAISDCAASIIVGHNHPSGILEPSHQDIVITHQLKEAGDIIGIPLLDHIIVSKNGHMSMKEKNLI